MKRIIANLSAAVLCLSAVLSFVGCGDENGGSGELRGEKITEAQWDEMVDDFTKGWNSDSVTIKYFENRSGTYYCGVSNSETVAIGDRTVKCEATEKLDLGNKREYLHQESSSRVKRYSGYETISLPDFPEEGDYTGSIDSFTVAEGETAYQYYYNTDSDDAVVHSLYSSDDVDSDYYGYRYLVESDLGMYLSSSHFEFSGIVSMLPDLPFSDFEFDAEDGAYYTVRNFALDKSDDTLKVYFKDGYLYGILIESEVNSIVYGGYSEEKIAVYMYFTDIGKTVVEAPSNEILAAIEEYKAAQQEAE